MVTIYTEHGPAKEALEEQEVGRKQFNFWQMAAICGGASLLLSLVACYNLRQDVKELTQNKVPQLQDMVSVLEMNFGNVLRKNQSLGSTPMTEIR